MAWLFSTRIVTTLKMWFRSVFKLLLSCTHRLDPTISLLSAMCVLSMPLPSFLPSFPANEVGQHLAFLASHKRFCPFLSRSWRQVRLFFYMIYFWRLIFCWWTKHYLDMQHLVRFILCGTFRRLNGGCLVDRNILLQYHVWLGVDHACLPKKR